MRAYRYVVVCIALCINSLHCIALHFTSRRIESKRWISAPIGSANRDSAASSAPLASTFVNDNLRSRTRAARVLQGLSRRSDLRALERFARVKCFKREGGRFQISAVKGRRSIYLLSTHPKRREPEVSLGAHEETLPLAQDCCRRAFIVSLALKSSIHIRWRRQQRNR